MPIHENPQSTPSDNNGTDSNGRVHSGMSYKEYQDLLTLSLDPDWEDAYAWSCAHNIRSELLLLLDATLCATFPNALGTFLHSISSVWARRHLEPWGDQWPAAKTILRLAYSLRAQDDILARYTALPNERSGRRQLHGDLYVAYIAALMVERFPPGLGDDGDWFKALRIWVLAHALERAAVENRQDKNLRKVSDVLRMAGDGNEDWIELILKLRVPIDSIEIFEQRLRFSIATVLKDGSKKLSQNQKSFLKALDKVSSHQNSPDDSTTINEIGLLQKCGLKVEDECRGAVHRIISDFIEDDECSGEHKRLYPTKDESEDLTSTKCDPSETYRKQKLQTNSIILYGVEELQYLPWSWSRPSPDETQRLGLWIDDALISNDQKKSLLGALVWMCCASGRSFRRLLELPIGNEPRSDWILLSSATAMTRLPPRRKPGWVPEDDQAGNWVVPAADRIDLYLPENVHTILHKRLSIECNAARIGDLWESAWGKAESLLNMSLSGSMHRVTPGMLGGVMAQRVFIKTGDVTFVRLLLSRENSGLTGACSYPSWSGEEVSRTLMQEGLSGGVCPRDSAIGSRLDPIESLLVDQIIVATNKLKQLRTTGSLVRFHNAYTAYLVTALLSATGARPIRDPFESWSHFDFAERFIYVDDKSSDELHQGRLVPIPDALSEFVQYQYRDHLRKVAILLGDRNPPLAAEIARLGMGESSDSMPCFFMLSEDDEEVAWGSVSEIAIDSLRLWSWPLPLNLFRHRLASQLRRLGVDPEIIDSINGHTESGCATHGDNSFRVWSEDMNELRQALNYLYSNLGFAVIEPMGDGTSDSQPSFAEAVYPRKSRIFGSQARRAESKLRLKLALKSAKKDIRQFLDGRELVQLSEEEFDKLSQLMLFSRNGLPNPLGKYKYKYLMRVVEYKWSIKGERARIARRYSALSRERSPFTPHACGATNTYSCLKSEIDTVGSSIRVSRLSVRACAVFGVVFLCIYNRIASKTILSDVLRCRNFRIVCLGADCYMEYAQGLTFNERRSAVKRFKLTSITAKLLDRALSAQNNFNLENNLVPNGLLKTCRILEENKQLGQGADLEALLESLCVVVNQFNVLHMPGMVSALQGGRLDSYSLGWSDWVRLKLGIAIRIDDPEESEPECDVPMLQDDVFPMNNLRGVEETVKKELLQNNARNLYKTITGRFLEYRGHGVERSINISERRELFANLRSAIKYEAAGVSSGVYALAEWAVSLLMRKTGTRTYVTLSTVSRYLGALTPSFSGVGYDFNIVTADSEDLTQFYSDAMNVRTVFNQQYVFDRLCDFHRWASKSYGLEDPEWSELPVRNAHISVSAGILTESDYLNAFALLGTLRDKGIKHANAAAFLLLLCYRFGLRSSESFGMTRADWQDMESAISVLVRSNMYRKLKTVTSRRNTPLVFRFTSDERACINKWLIGVEATHGNTLDAPLFGDISGKPDLMNLRRVKNLALYAIKRVTGNSRITIHHARHSAGNCVAMKLLDVEPGFWRSQACNDASDIEMLLLGRKGPTRRKAWAIARYLGHVRLATTFGNYIHFLSDWADDIVHGAKVALRRPSLKTAIILDDFPVVDITQEIEHLQADKKSEPSIYDLLRFVHLVSLGRPSILAASVLDIENDLSRLCIRTLKELSSKVRVSKACGDGNESDEMVIRQGILSHISQTAWLRLLQFAQEIEKTGLESFELSRSVCEGYVDMIGATRQLVMWNADQFEAIKYGLEYYGVTNNRYEIYHSPKVTDGLMEQAGRAGLNLKSTKKHADNRYRPQLDAGYESSNKNRVESRCALLFKENSTYYIRNSIELAILMSVFFLSKLTKSDATATVSH